MTKETDTEEIILQSARRVFERKGLVGSRMQEIADEAGINKALLHYYYRSKDKLFEAVFRQTIREHFPVLTRIINGDLPLIEKIKALVPAYISVIQQNEFIPAFIMQELNRNPENLIKIIMENEDHPEPLLFFKDVEKAIQAGEIRPIDPAELLVNILALCIFPFLMKPMVSAFNYFPDDVIEQRLDIRKETVVNFILNSIKPVL